MTVVRFCGRFGIPTSTWYYWRRIHLEGRLVRRWPTPALDAIEALAVEKKDDERFSPWGHRKIWGLLRADGVAVSASSVKRALGRRGLLLPARYQAERRALARARKGVFKYPTPRRNRVWQMDFSEFETTTAGTWMLSGVVDYWAKVCLTATANATQTARDAVASLEAALAEAEALMGHSMAEDCVDADTGEVFAVVIVTDNGPAYKSDRFARFIAARPWMVHVRTRYRSPQTNGVIERFYGSLKYEHLYRREVANGMELNDECEAYRRLYNEIRPHETLGLHPPLATYLAAPISFEHERELNELGRAEVATTESRGPASAMKADRGDGNSAVSSPHDVAVPQTGGEPPSPAAGGEVQPIFPKSVQEP
ncbi:MAG TPA: integrase core domain-containing protein [Acidimicrobiales bacterium]|nr:integrase core domain-containing protein [Acidimicrobiales bacterium]